MPHKENKMGSIAVDRTAGQNGGCESTGTECLGEETSNRNRPCGEAARRIAWSLVILFALLLAGYLFRAPLLTGVAHAWMVNNPVMKADAIVVLGGGLENRPFAAAKLYHAGVAPRILFMDVRHSPVEEIGITPSEGELTHRVLLRLGVPETAMTMIGKSVASTYDESRAVEAWMEKTGAKSIIIPTDLFHTRRVRWIFGKELRSLQPEIHVVPIGSPRYKADDWWQHEDGIIAFETEIFKNIYYRVKY